MRETFAEQRDKQSLVGRLVLNYRDNMNAKDPETGEFKKDQYIGKVESYNERCACDACFDSSSHVREEREAELLLM